jgi:hypothetical protein
LILRNNLIRVPFVARLRSPSTYVVGELLTEFLAPLSDWFVRHAHTPRSEQFFDVAKAEVEPEIQPHRVRDDLLGNRKPV